MQCYIMILFADLSLHIYNIQYTIIYDIQYTIYTMLCHDTACTHELPWDNIFKQIHAHMSMHTILFHDFSRTQAFFKIYFRIAYSQPVGHEMLTRENRCVHQCHCVALILTTVAYLGGPLGHGPPLTKFFFSKICPPF